MPASSKVTATPSKDKDRRKSASGKPSHLTTVRVTPSKLRHIVDPSSVKEESPVKDSPGTSATLPNEVAAAPTLNGDANGDPVSESNPGTPAPNGTPSQAPMGPPADGPKKKGVKRSANGGDLAAKIRGKPGPKKKPRLEDGTIDPNGRNGGAYHKLGPKANQGAINAGLRALDRSGAPCRKWAKGGFRMKSFTGVVWEVPRWTAPPKPTPEATPEESAASGENSNKENKEGSQLKSENSNSHAEGERPSVPPSVNASSPAPIPVAAAS